MTPCKRCLSLGSAYLDGELNPAERAEIDAHLGICADCRAEFGALERSVSMLRSLPAVGTDDLFADRVFRRIEAIEARGRREAKRHALPRPVFTWGWLRPAVAGAAVVLLVLAAQNRIGPGGPARDTASREAAAPAESGPAVESPSGGSAALEPEVAPTGTSTQGAPAPGVVRGAGDETLAEVFGDSTLSPYDGTAVSLNSDTDYIMDVYRYQPSNGASREVRRVSTRGTAGVRRVY